MKKLRGLVVRLGGLFNKQRKDRELEEEMKSHIQMHVDDNIRLGMTPEAARREALIMLGGIESTKEAYRDQRGLPMLETLWQDIRYGARMLRKNPGFTSVAAVTLALGIGANTAIFTLVNAVWIKKLPVKEPDRLVLLRSVAPREFVVGSYAGNSGGYAESRTGSRSMTSFPYQSFARMREQSSALSGLIAFGGVRGGLNVTADGQADMASGQAVSGNYFVELGVQPWLGRLLIDEDDRAGSSPVAVLNHRYWQQHFGGSPEVIGKQINLNKVAFTIVGVTPPGFEGTMGVGSTQDVTIPIAWEPQVVSNKEYSRMYGAGAWWLRLMGRLKPEATAEQARLQLEEAFHRSVAEYHAARQAEARANGESPISELDPKLYPRLLIDAGGQGEMDGRRFFAPSLFLLQGVVGLVLLIACANVANLLFSRAATRQKEVALRLAIGAGRWRLIRQLLTESVLLSALGGALGVLLAIWLQHGLLAVSDWGSDSLIGLAAKLDWRVLGFTTGLSLLTGICFGLAPAWQFTKVDMGPALKDSGRNSSAASRSFLSRCLVVSQLALSLLIMVGAGLLVRTLLNLQRVEPGFNMSNLLLFRIQPDLLGYQRENLALFYGRLAERLEVIPGVQAVTFSDIPLLSQWSSSYALYLPNALNAAPDSQGMIQPSGLVCVDNVRENFLDVMQIPLLAGRTLRSQDDAKAPRVAVVNQSLAHKFFPNENPIGKRFAFDSKKPDSVEIVGLAKDAKYTRQRDEIAPTAYLPWQQDLSGEVTFELRTKGDPTAMIPSVRQAIRQVDGLLPVTDIKTQVQRANETLRMDRWFAKLLTLFGVLAALLASIGLFGIMAYAVSQRIREIGIRMALGATRHDVLKLVVRQGMTLVWIGIALGLVATLLCTRVIQSRLYGITPSDPFTLVIVSALLIVVAMLASWLPARFAARVEPIVALRNE
jgi:predicted permease